MRAPFLLVAACIPWLVARITAREFNAIQGWQAGSFALLLPLAGTLGLLAVPDAVMTFATLLCMDAGTRLLRGVTATAALELAVGLAIGALSHYRFLAVIGVGFIALLLIPEGRRALRDPRVWVAIAFGIAAWTPLLAWNMANAEAGLRFQLVDRHPWAFHADGIGFVLIQARAGHAVAVRGAGAARLGAVAATTTWWRVISACWARCWCLASSRSVSSPIPSASVSIGRCPGMSHCCHCCRRCC